MRPSVGCGIRRRLGASIRLPGSRCASALDVAPSRGSHRSASLASACRDEQKRVFKFKRRAQIVVRVVFSLRSRRRRRTGDRHVGRGPAGRQRAGVRRARVHGRARAARERGTRVLVPRTSEVSRTDDGARRDGEHLARGAPRFVGVPGNHGMLGQRRETQDGLTARDEFRRRHAVSCYSRACRTSPAAKATWPRPMRIHPATCPAVAGCTRHNAKPHRTVHGVSRCRWDRPSTPCVQRPRQIARVAMLSRSNHVDTRTAMISVAHARSSSATRHRRRSRRCDARVPGFTATDRDAAVMIAQS